MASSTTFLETISQGQSGKEATANNLFDAMSAAALYGRHAEACIGLTWAYYGGVKREGTTNHVIANGTVALTASATNYIEIDNAGVVYKVTGTPTGGRLLLYTIVVGATAVTSYTDHRNGTQGLDFSVSGVTPGAADIDIADAGGYYTGTNVETALQEIGAALPQVATVTYAATLNLSANDYNDNELIQITLTGNVVINLSATGATPNGKRLRFLLIQDATGGRTVSLNTGFAFGADITGFTASTAANKQDYIGVVFNTTANQFRLIAVVKGY